MYEDLILMEPLEYKEMHKLQDFVIAIDTSGSCSGEVVRQFLEETWEIFCEEDNFFRRMNLHLIQCDCMIQEHVCITCEEEWKDYLNRIEVKGHGDTDFTPVFQLVDKMLEQGELRDLKGLIYFTDGDGIYPSEKPAYETAFVFLNRELTKGQAPAWAQTLTLDRQIGEQI
jgi:predicted metal-dependent peptidase